MSVRGGPAFDLHGVLARLRHLAGLTFALLADFSERRVQQPSLGASLATAVGATALLGLGGWLWWVSSGFGDARAVFVKSVLFGTLVSILLWLVWLLVVYALLQRLAGVTARVEELVREAGYAAAPLALGVLMAVPAIAFGVGLVALCGWVLATQHAIERATGLRGRPAMIANLAGFGVWAVLLSLLTTAANQLGPGPLLAESIWDTLSGYEVGRSLVGG